MAGTSAARVSDRPSAQWLRVSAPHLRIVPGALWHAAHAKIAEARADTYVRHSASRESKYLLPGMARCAWCNGGMYVRTRRQGTRERLALYACSSHFHLGETVCRNHLQFPMHAIDQAAMNAIDEIMTVDIVDEIIARVREELDPRNRDDAHERIEQQIATVDQQIENLADAIAIGGDVPALAKRLAMAHQRRQELVVSEGDISRRLPFSPRKLAARRAPSAPSASRVARATRETEACSGCAASSPPSCLKDRSSSRRSSRMRGAGISSVEWSMALFS